MRPQNACQRKTPVVKDKEKREREKISDLRKSLKKTTRKAPQGESRRRHLEAAVQAGQRRSLQLTATRNVPVSLHPTPERKKKKIVHEGKIPHHVLPGHCHTQPEGGGVLQLQTPTGKAT